MRSSRKPCAEAISSLCALAACSGGADSAGHSVPSDAGAAPAITPADAGVCSTGSTRACTCDGGSGVATCVAGAWGACYCAPPPVPVQRGGDCREGLYQGDFQGLAGAPVPLFPVAGLSLSGTPALSLRIEASGSGEFVLLGKGKLAGSANGLFDFDADVAGTLDCAAKRFTGTLTGSAKDVFGLFLNQVFTGTMTADYDAVQSGFVNGTWDLRSGDANAVDGGFTLGPTDVTGNGDWNAALAVDAGADGGAADAGGSDAGP